MVFNPSTGFAISQCSYAYSEGRDLVAVAMPPDCCDSCLGYGGGIHTLFATLVCSVGMQETTVYCKSYKKNSALLAVMVANWMHRGVYRQLVSISKSFVPNSNSLYLPPRC
jgi:hypothetical protein